MSTLCPNRAPTIDQREILLSLSILRSHEFEPTQGQVSSLISPHYPRRLLGPVYPKQCAQKRPKAPLFHFIS